MSCEMAVAYSERVSTPAGHSISRTVTRVDLSPVYGAERVGKTVVVIIPSFAERYLYTALFEGL